MSSDRSTVQDDSAIEVRRAHGFWLQSYRYLVVGGISFLIYFGLLGLLFGGLGAPYPIAVGVAYALAVAVHFSANRTFTFGAINAPVTVQLGRYGGILLLNYGIQMSVLYVLYSVCRFDFYLGAVCGVLVTLVTGFSLMKTWVFASKGSSGRRAALRTPLPRTDRPFQVGEE